DAVAFANAVAATATTARGAMAALPTREAVGPLLEGGSDR
ncbi:carbohydrate kinase, partial [Natrinema soli]